MEMALLKNPIIDNYFDVLKKRFRLTDRELEIIKLLSLVGPNNQVLAKTLHLSENTAKNHIANIQKKLDARSCREIQAIVFRDSLLNFFLGVFKSTDTEPEGYHVLVSNQ